MTKKHINTFSGGIDRDTSVNKYDNTHYYDAENVRPISNDTFTSGSMSNVDGLLEKIDFENITVNLPPGSFISNITIYKVIAIRDSIVIFANFLLTIANELDPGQTVDGIITADLINEDFVNFNIPVYYFNGDNNPLDFNSNMSVVGHYESQNIQKVYWADGTNPLRTINIKRTPSFITPGELDHVPDVTFSNITDLEVVSGGSYTSGIVQYAYQLYDLHGAITTISPVSNPVLLSSFSESEIGGSDIGVNTNKSVKFTISDLDTRFSRIRVIALFYEELLGNPQINVIYEGVNNVNISIVDTNRPIDTLTYEEFLTFNNTTYIPNSLETKNNILFSANVKEVAFKSEAIDNWDSRAYMFRKNSTILEIIDKGSVKRYSSWDDIPNNSDALSPDTSSSGFKTTNLSYDYSIKDTDLRAYQYNSSTLGGEGPNIKFTYNIYDDVLAYRNSYAIIDPFKHTITGLQPNEVYRFGIVFYNQKGQVSFVKWIQDIRIPYVEVASPISSNTFESYDYIDPYTSRHLGRSINIVFTLKNPPADPNIKSWQIVRAKRNLEDREVLYNGYFVAAGIRGTDTFSRTWLTGATTQNFDGSSKYFSGLPLETNNIATADRPVLWEFLCPEINFNKSVYDISNAKILINNYTDYDTVSKEYDRHDINTAIYKNSYIWDSTFNTTGIKNYTMAKPDTFTGNPNVGVIHILGETDKERFLNLTRPLGSTHEDNIGIGGTKLIINSDLFELNSFPATGWDLNNGDYFRTLYGQIVRDVSNSRYGGITYEARQLTEYIPYSSVNSISTYTDATTRSKFNGDTFVKIFVYLRNIAQEDYPNEWGGYDALQEVVMMPIHTSINLDYRNDDILKYITLEPIGGVDSEGNLKDMWVQETVELGMKYQSYYYNEDIGDLYTYNSVYSKENEAKKFYPKPFDFVEEEFIDTKILASDEKFNGESIDSWTIFKSNNFIEIESDYGPIVSLKRFMNSLFTFQPEGVAIIAVNDRSLIQDQSGAKLALGTGGILERYDYISYEKGITRPQALVASKKALYFIDEINKEFNVISGSNIQEISRIKGFSSEINSLIPSDKILTGFDPNFKEIYLTFDNITWVYSELLQSMIGKFSVDNPDSYLSFKGNLYSTKNNILSIHNDPNSKLGSKSYITLLINPNSNIICSFDNLDFRTEVDSISKTTVDRIIFSNSYIDPIIKTTKLTDPGKTVSYLARSFRTQVPQTPDGNRFVDSYILVTFEFDNTSNNKFKLHDVITYYRDAKI